MLFPIFTQEIKNLDPVEFRCELKNAKRARLIDVSTKAEYDELHIPGSWNLDVLSPEFVDQVERLERNNTYFVYSKDGKRGETAVMILKELGFKRIYNLVSGLKSWKGTLERSY